ncbi:MAG: hypothetical protein NTY19_08135 [Planctomycetota bacterium]|nr:hypothetical protein [Planctomycetota bacterium]
MAAIGFACAAFGKSEENERNGLWIAAGGCAAISFLAWVFIPAGSQSNSLTPNQLKGQQTLAYWNGLPSALQSVGQNQPRNMQEEVILLNSIAARIDRLPTSVVDADAIQCGLALRNWLRAVADDKARANSPQFAIQTFARGFQGDVLGPIVEYAQNSAALEQQHAAVGDQFAATRARLSSRYDIEFPPVLR